MFHKIVFFYQSESGYNLMKRRETYIFSRMFPRVFVRQSKHEYNNINLKSNMIIQSASKLFSLFQIWWCAEGIIHFIVFRVWKMHEAFLHHSKVTHIRFNKYKSSANPTKKTPRSSIYEHDLATCYKSSYSSGGICDLRLLFSLILAFRMECTMHSAISPHVRLKLNSKQEKCL